MNYFNNNKTSNGTKEIRLAHKVITTLVKDRLHYPGRLFADTSSIAMKCGVVLLLYAYVFKLNGGAIRGVIFPIAAWSIFFHFTFFMLGLRSVAYSIMRDVTSGHIEVWLSKPITYLTYRAWWQIGSGAYPFLVTAILGVLILMSTVGIPETMAQVLFLPTFALVFVGGMLLVFLVYGIVGLLAFWVEDIVPIFWIVDKTVMILGGAYLPVALFPEFMYKAALYSPFGAALFITHTPYVSWVETWPRLVGIQMLWVLILGLIAYGMFKRAVKNVSVNGG